MVIHQEICGYCDNPLPVTKRGRKWCSNACRQAHHRYAREAADLRRRFGPSEPPEQTPHLISGDEIPAETAQEPPSAAPSRQPDGDLFLGAWA